MWECENCLGSPGFGEVKMWGIPTTNNKNRQNSTNKMSKNVNF